MMVSLRRLSCGACLILWSLAVTIPAALAAGTTGADTLAEQLQKATAEKEAKTNKQKQRNKEAAAKAARAKNKVKPAESSN